MIYEILFILPIGYLFIKTIKDLYNKIDKLENNTIQSYKYLHALFQKYYDYDYKLLTNNINNINSRLDSIKLNVSHYIGEINKIKYNIDKLYNIEDKHTLQNIERLNNLDNKIEEFNEDMKIMKSIYSLTINELKNDIIDITGKIEDKYNYLNNTFSYEKIANELAFNNLLDKIKQNNIYEYEITFGNINQIIKNHNIENIGTNYFINISKNNYRNIDKDYSTINYKCRNVINYKISIHQDNEKIIISKPHNNNYLLINISYSISLTFFKNEQIGSSQDMCYIIPNHAIDNEFPKILKDNELEEYNKSIKLLNDNYEIVKQEINKFVKKELEEVSLEPLIANFLL